MVFAPYPPYFLVLNTPLSLYSHKLAIPPTPSFSFFSTSSSTHLTSLYVDNRVAYSPIGSKKLGDNSRVRINFFGVLV